MRRIFAIAQLAVRAAIRSRLVVCLLLLLLGAVIGLPLTLQSDGTPEGHVRLVLGYTMGFASVILALTALWSGALSISREVADKQIQMLCSKPVHRFEIWFGKWLGLTAVHAVLLALCAAATYTTLQASLGSTRFSETQRDYLKREVLTARRPQRPPPPEVEAAAQALLRDRKERGLLPAGISMELALRSIRQELIVQALTVPPGGQLSWTFTLPADLPPGAELRLNYRFSTSRFGLMPAQGTWFIGPALRMVTTNQPSIPHTLRFAADSAQGKSDLVVRYVNDDPDPFTVVFPPGQGVELQLPAGTFPANFARANLLVLFRIALLCAIGVTAGTLFSSPVAILMSLAAVIILQASGYVGTLAHQDRLTPWSLLGESSPGLADHVLRGLFRVLDLVIAPLQTGRPMDQAATGVMVEPMSVVGGFVVQIILYGGLLALISTFVFNRRELALPSA
jgi:hypothetical protein